MDARRQLIGSTGAAHMLPAAVGGPQRRPARDRLLPHDQRRDQPERHLGSSGRTRPPRRTNATAACAPASSTATSIPASSTTTARSATRGSSAARPASRATGRCSTSPPLRSIPTAARCSRSPATPVAMTPTGDLELRRPASCTGCFSTGRGEEAGAQKKKTKPKHHKHGASGARRPRRPQPAGRSGRGRSRGLPRAGCRRNRPECGPRRAAPHIANPPQSPPPMTALAIVFWISVGLLVYAHAGYGLLLAGLARLRRRPARAASAADPRSPERLGDRRRLRRGGGDHGPDGQPQGARLPARAPRGDRGLRRLARRHRRASPRRRRRPRARAPAGRQDPGPGRGGRAHPAARSSPSPTPT